ncbi:MAG: NADH-quinone oxidoreductase subunit M, partial [Candidatus Melainabacteria bacterium]|nr:NADH-quinone oxidoreductase subunit M [Candidatus Melainabacteria bacterium]
MIDFFVKHALSTILTLSLLGALFVALMPNVEKGCRNVSLLFSGLILLVSLFMIFYRFDPTLTSLQYVENYKWFGDTIRFKLGTDGLSASMILLMAILLPV